MNGNPAVRITRELMDAEAASGFARLREVPSSTVRRFLDYHGELPPGDAEALRAALAERGALALRPPRDGPLPLQAGAAYEAWTNALLSPRFVSSPRYQPLRLAKNIVGAGLAADWGLDPEAADALAATKAATAGGLRRLIKPVFASRFDLAARNQGGGDWSYERDDGTLKVRLDFGGRTDQLRYWVTAGDTSSGVRVGMATYEGLLGLAGGWDWIADDDAARAVDLLADFVALIETLPGRLAGESPSAG